MTRMDLATLSPLREPWAFVVAAVLSPGDESMDTSDAALGLLEAEAERCAVASPKVRNLARWQRVCWAIGNVMKLRKAKR